MEVSIEGFVALLVRDTLARRFYSSLALGVGLHDGL